MLYNYDFDIAAVILTGAVILLYALRRAYRTRGNNIFLGMLILNLLASVIDFLTAFTISFPQNFPAWLDWVDNIGFLICHSLTAVSFFAYVCTLVKGDQNMSRERTVWRVAGTILVILLVTTPFTHAIFYLDQDLNYCHGPLFPILYIISVALLIYSIALMLRYRNRLSNYQAIAMLFYIGAVFVAIVLHILFPEILLEEFAASMALVLLYLSLENPEFYMYKNTYCYNSRALSITVNELINSERPFALVGFSFSDVNKFVRSVDSEIMDSLSNALIKLLHSSFPKEHVFCLGKMQFGVLVHAEKKGSELLDDIKQQSLEATEIIEGQIRARSGGVMPFFHIIYYPDFIKNVDDFNSALSFGLSGIGATGSSRITISNRNSLNQRDRKASVLDALRRALENRTLTINYQPIKQVSDGKFVSAEALCRLIDDELGFISPDEFIPLAEENGLAAAISDYVVNESCRFWQENKLEELGVEYLEVNLSALDFMRENLAETLLGILSEHGISPSQINFEITETSSTGIDDLLFTSTMKDMVAKGMRFSVDDFGSGYASISYLIQVPAELVKIDKSILRAAMEDKDAHTVLLTTLSLLSRLGKHSLCEGVETEAMATMLTEMGCQYFQGYLYSKPLKGSDYIEFLKANN